ncbi:hypothetical protein Bbelb_135680 [Branchiostoma belcheri]|nr:hypothetical protein Bbelb_135680 [Branchiostoma belcheri]
MEIKLWCGMPPGSNIDKLGRQAQQTLTDGLPVGATTSKFDPDEIIGILVDCTIRTAYRLSFIEMIYKFSCPEYYKQQHEECLHVVKQKLRNEEGLTIAFLSQSAASTHWNLQDEITGQARAEFDRTKMPVY